MASRGGRALFTKIVRKYSCATESQPKLDISRGSESKHNVVRGGDIKHHKLVIAGGGTGGCSVSARACRVLGPGNVGVVEPSEVFCSKCLMPFVAVFNEKDSSPRQVYSIIVIYNLYELYMNYI